MFTGSSALQCDSLLSSTQVVTLAYSVQLMSVLILIQTADEYIYISAPQETKERERPEEKEKQFRDWVETDNDLSIVQIMSDEDIMQSLTPHNAQNTGYESNDDDEEEEPVRKPINKKMVRESLITIRTLLDSLFRSRTL